MLLHKNLLIVVGAATLGFATLSSVRPVEASVLFDEIGTLNPFNTQRDGGDAPVGRYTFNQQTTITSFSVLNALSTAGDLKFLIFNSGNGDLLFSSNPKTFASDGGTGLANNTFKESDPLSFTFLPGITYGLTATSSVLAGYYVAFDSVAENGITALTGNQNVIGSFNNPSLQLGTNCCSVPVKLFSSDIQPVPEPSLSLGLLALGTLGAASTLKRKLKSSKSSEKETTKVG